MPKDTFLSKIETILTDKDCFNFFCLNYHDDNKKIEESIEKAYNSFESKKRIGFSTDFMFLYAKFNVPYTKNILRLELKKYKRNYIINNILN